MKKTILFWKLLALSTFSLIAQNGDIDSIIWKPLSLGFETLTVRRGDTIFNVRIYPSKNKIDSIVFYSYSTKFARGKWIYKQNTVLHVISRYKKTKSSKWFKENNSKYFQADYECIPTRSETYDKERNLIQKYRKFGCFSHVSETHPKKK